MALAAKTAPFVLVGLSSCYPSAPKEPVAPPAVLAPAFASCAPGGGVASVDVFSEDQFLAAFTVDWRAWEDGRYTVVFTNPLGQTLLSLHADEERIETTGPAAPQVPALGVGEKGFLTLDDRRIGFRVWEIPCLVGAKLPRSWLPFLQSWDTQPEGRLTAAFADDFRSITLTARQSEAEREDGEEAPPDREAERGNDPLRDICSEISWSHYLGLVGADVQWCLTEGGGSLTGIEDYRLEWMGLGE